MTKTTQPGAVSAFFIYCAYGLRAAALLAAAAGIACGPAPEQPTAADTGDEAPAAAEAPDAFAWPEGPHPTATLRIAGLGEIVIELYPELAPATVANFEQLAAAGFYDGTTFHRVIPGFMIQGGDPNTRDDDPVNDGHGGSEERIPDEISGAPHVPGVVSMANLGSPNSATSQFFIVIGDARHLDAKHSVFGRVRSGDAVVEAITAVETDVYGRWGPKQRPIEDVVIEGVVLDDARQEAEAVAAR